MSACNTNKSLKVEVYETSASGNKLTKITEFSNNKSENTITILPTEEFQTITGFGGSFTESSAYLLNKLSKENRDKVLNAYFSEEGANYTLTRTHISSCDFSLNNYIHNLKKGLKEYKEESDAHIFKNEFENDDVKLFLIRHIIFLLYILGFLLLAIPAIDTFLSISVTFLEKFGFLFGIIH